MSADGERQLSEAEERQLSEAEYRAWVNWKASQMAAEFSERYRDILPEGMRFEWIGLDDTEVTQ